jgi:dihydrofolate reductase
LKNYVFSRTLPRGVRHGVRFVSGDPRAFVSRLKRTPGKDIWLCGGGELAREFLKRDAIDEVGMGIVPLLIGAGRPTFPPGFDEVELELKETKPYPAGVVVLIYRVVRPARRPVNTTRKVKPAGKREIPEGATDRA